MEDLFKIDKIDGKGYGWIALQDIKPGRLIYKEKQQFVVDSETRVKVHDLMRSFYAMTENDQKEFLELHNKYMDLNSLPDSEKKLYFDCKKYIATLWENITSAPYFDSNLVLKIFCIHITNGFKGSSGVGIKTSRINHSCCPNSEPENWSEGEMAIRATSKILEGQEITISYLEPMKNFKERQESCHKHDFVCSCEICQDEEINKDDETYEKFQNLKEEAERIADLYHFKNRLYFEFPPLEKALACQKQMYNLAKKKKAPKSFIHDILKTALEYAGSGLSAAEVQKNHGKMKYFKGECENLSKVGFKITKMCFSPEHAKFKEWKEISQDFDNWHKKQSKKRGYV